MTCISTLEHIDKYEDAVASMFKVLKPGGHLVLTFPYNERKGVDNVYLLPESGARGKPRAYGTRVYSREDVDRWCKTHGASVSNQEYWRFFTGEYWTIGEFETPPQKVAASDLHQISCVVFKKN